VFPTLCRRYPRMTDNSAREWSGGGPGSSLRSNANPARAPSTRTKEGVPSLLGPVVVEIAIAEEPVPPDVPRLELRQVVLVQFEEVAQDGLVLERHHLQLQPIAARTTLRDGDGLRNVRRAPGRTLRAVGVGRARGCAVGPSYTNPCA